MKSKKYTIAGGYTGDIDVEKDQLPEIQATNARSITRRLYNLFQKNIVLFWM